MGLSVRLHTVCTCWCVTSAALQLTQWNKLFRLRKASNIPPRKINQAIKKTTQRPEFHSRPKLFHCCTVPHCSVTSPVFPSSYPPPFLFHMLLQWGTLKALFVAMVCGAWMVPNKHPSAPSPQDGHWKEFFPWLLPGRATMSGTTPF